MLEIAHLADDGAALHVEATDLARRQTQLSVVALLRHELGEGAGIRFAERFERLRLVVERSAERKHAARIGRLEEVLVEGPSKRDPGVVTGRTGQNKLVHFPVGGAAPAVGSYATVEITEAARHHLTGTLVEVTARPVHRVRIPVSAG